VLRGVVAGPALVRLVGGDGGDRDDLPVPGGDEERQQRLGDADGAKDVDVVHPLPVVEVGLGDGGEAERAAGVVDQEVAAVDPGGEGGHGVLVGDVERQG